LTQPPTGTSAHCAHFPSSIQSRANEAALNNYEIAPEAGPRRIARDGEAGMSYLTAEAAFEIVVTQASIEMRSNNESEIRICPVQPTEQRSL
jgi:hypothetical protein